MRSISDEDDNVGQPNEYNLNDSFIDDEEEEYEPTDEDSDWEPEKEDLEKEDMEGLLKEAKKFMKRKKWLLCSNIWLIFTISLWKNNSGST